MTDEHRRRLSEAKRQFYFSRVFLVREYVDNHRTMRNIALDYGCNPECVARALRRYGISSRKSNAYPSPWKGRKNPILLARNLFDNPAKRPEVREAKRLHYLNHPELHANNKLSRAKATCLERAMIELLTQIGLTDGRDFVFNKFIKTNRGFRFPDFRILKVPVIIECDGQYWHTDKLREMKRDMELSQLGYRVLHFSDHDINKHLAPVLRFFT